MSDPWADAAAQYKGGGSQSVTPQQTPPDWTVWNQGGNGSPKPSDDPWYKKLAHTVLTAPSDFVKAGLDQFDKGGDEVFGTGLHGSYRPPDQSRGE